MNDVILDVLLVVLELEPLIFIFIPIISISTFDFTFISHLNSNFNYFVDHFVFNFIDFYPLLT